MKKTSLLQVNYKLLLGLIALFILNTSDMQSQNLVLNPSFEKTKAKFVPCAFMDNDYVFTDYVNSWSTMYNLTPDLLRSPASEDSATCEFTSAKTGRNAAGIITYYPSMDSGKEYDFHEYIQGALKQPLVKGQKYVVRFWVQQNKELILRHLKSKYKGNIDILPVATDNLGIHFSTSRFGQTDVMHELIRDYGVKAHITFEQIISTDQDEWIQLQMIFEAKGDWQYFTIGNFATDLFTTTDLGLEKEEQINQINESVTPLRGRTKRVAYYLIDDVDIRLYDEAEFLANTLQNTSNYTFQNLQFDTGKSALKTNSRSELDALIKWLNSSPYKSIQINGHTDNIGSPTANQKLSEARAKAVYDYLLQNGINATRLSYKGHGDTQPKVANDSAKNRAINRRVECQITD